MSRDDHEPGGSEPLSGSELLELGKIFQPGGSGAGSTVEHVGLPGGSFQTLVEITRERDQLRAALEAARKIAYLPCGWNHCVGECQCRHDAGRPTTYQAAYEQSRATEAELRATVERREAVVEAVRAYVAYCVMTNSVYPTAFAETLAALDAAEQPARAEGGQG